MAHKKGRSIEDKVSPGRWRNYRWQMHSRTLITTLSCMTIVVAAACSSPPPASRPSSATRSGHRQPSPLTSPQRSVAGLQPSTAHPCGSTQARRWQHIVWIIMENKSYSQIVGAADAPYENHLAAECGLATDYHAVSHPSLPNYIALTSGSTHGITDDDPPSAHPIGGSSLFSQLGADWSSLQESMPSNCDTSSTGEYAVKHNPAAYFTDIRNACDSQDVPLTQPPDISHRFTLITPNLCHDMHDCPVSTGDGWLATFLPTLLNSRQYRAGSTAVFLTYDEDDGSGDNQVATFVIAPTVPTGTRSSTPFTHYSLLRTTEEMLGFGRLGGAGTANSMRRAFHL